MPVHNLYIFNRAGQCIYYKEWNRTKKSGLSQEQEFKQMFGLITEIKSFVSKMAPGDLKDGFTGFRTNSYRLNYYETPSGVKLILNTEINTTGNPREILHQMYETILVPLVVRNPVGSLDEPIKNQMFDTKLDAFIRRTPLF